MTIESRKDGMARVHIFGLGYDKRIWLSKCCNRIPRAEFTGLGLAAECPKCGRRAFGINEAFLEKAWEANDDD